MRSFFSMALLLSSVQRAFSAGAGLPACFPRGMDDESIEEKPMIGYCTGYSRPRLPFSERRLSLTARPRVPPL